MLCFASIVPVLLVAWAGEAEFYPALLTQVTGSFSAAGSFLYAVTFGGFVAFSTYMPTYLKDIDDFDLTGIVGAAGGLGGFFPPLVMGATYDPGGSDYLVGLLLLCATALVALVFTAVRLRRDPA